MYSELRPVQTSAGLKRELLRNIGTDKGKEYKGKGNDDRNQNEALLALKKRAEQ